MSKTYTELIFDWGKLSGYDALNIEDELAALGKPAVVAAFSGEYKIRMAARACSERIGFDAFKHMPIQDFNRITGEARSFLLRSESSAATEENGSDSNA